MKKKGVSYSRWGYIFLIPFFTVYVVFQLIPLLMTFVNAFYENYMSGLKQVGPNFVGLENFKIILESDLLKYLGNTVILWMIGFIRLISKMHLMDSFMPLIMPSVAAPVVFFFMKQYMESNLPLEIVEASRIDGAGEFYTFNRIVIPIMKPALAVQAIFSFVMAWNNYFVPGLVLKSNEKATLPILIARLRSADYLKFDMGMVYMMIAVSIVPVIIVYLFLSKFIIRGVTLGSIKG